MFPNHYLLVYCNFLVFSSSGVVAIVLSIYRLASVSFVSTPCSAWVIQGFVVCLSFLFITGTLFITWEEASMVWTDLCMNTKWSNLVSYLTYCTFYVLIFYFLVDNLQHLHLWVKQTTMAWTIQLPSTRPLTLGDTSLTARVTLTDWKTHISETSINGLFCLRTIFTWHRW